MTFLTGENALLLAPLAPVEIPAPDTREHDRQPLAAARGQDDPVKPHVDDAAVAERDSRLPDLSALLAQARAAQKQLAGQPLPIANYKLPLIQKLFGG